MVSTAAADDTCVQPEAAASRERTGSQYRENEEVKKAEEPKNTQEKLLDLLMGLTERMKRLEVPQERQEEKEWLKNRDPSVFGLSLRTMDCQALGQTLPPRTSPRVSPATYLSLRQREYANAATNLEMAQAPQHYVPPQAYQPQQPVPPPPGHCASALHEAAQARDSPVRRQGALPRFGEWLPALGQALRAPDLVRRASERLSVDSGTDNLVLDNILHYADPAMRVSMLWRLNLARTDYLRQAEELVHFAQSTKIELRGKQLGRVVVNDGQADNRKCFKRGKPGHLKATCPNKKQEWSEGGDADFVLTVDVSSIMEGVWILDIATW
ncbi:hypothetical protein PC129_g7438 [Phytophthora cactorum]|nr:hypothetical protein PC112_g16221 [Phytophthora cactorum]KAG2810647.1 hypothetical protein PC111_g15559 [Phytophthora cactorum]KAG2865554.1 hypothetical protein PC113_g3623 [Phytophthora cactorum]KAG2971426.1 hypothetical protein PC118_g16286 [Phytophthora cactorum]KAG2998860.1 hypothetical protein PC119_g17348 [Phytophthora cactorum]